MASPDARRRLFSIGLFVLPLVTVQVASVVMGGPSPSGASASSSSGDPAPAVAAPGASTGASVQWTTAQHAAADHVRFLASTAFGPTPMFHTERPKVVEEQPQSQPDIELPKVPEVPAFELHAIMNTASGDKALINGRSYLVGQSIETTGWRVHSINVGDRSVVLEEIEGTREITISVRRSD